MPNEELIHYKTCIFRDIKEHTPDIQLNLPDYYPDVCRILTCQANAYIENCKNEGDRITVEGIVVYRLFYCSESKTVHLYEAEQRFNKTFECCALASDAMIDCRLKNVNVNFRAIGPRRVDVKSTVSVTVEVFELKEITANSEFSEGVECLHREYELFDVHACYCGSFTVDEIFTVQDERIADSRILFENSKINISEIKTVKDKILIKGVAELNCTFLHTKDCTLIKYSENVPFTQIIDLYGVTESDRCHIIANPQRLFLTVKDTGECSMQLCVRIIVYAGDAKTITVVSDLFAPGFSFESKQFNGRMQKGLKNISDTFQCSAKFENGDFAESKIQTVLATDLSYSAKFSQGMMNITGQVTLGVLLQTEDELQFCTRYLPFEYNRDVGEMADGDFICTINCRNPICNNTAQGLVLKAEMELNGFCVAEEAVSFTENCTLSEPCNGDKEFETISLYFAHCGESVWDIGKKNNVSLQLLKTANAIVADVIDEDCVLILIGAEG
ncbi:MAG: DUF3794 domain-containing protein [Clostridia bacterium]|nr:DUF3794 domain-containing protein [Clostridia bacterium]